MVVRTAAGGGDITTGLPRVEELFEARKKPKGESVMTDIGGILRLNLREDGVQVATVIDSEVVNEEHRVPFGWDILVEDESEIKPDTAIASEIDGDRVLTTSLGGTVYLENG